MTSGLRVTNPQEMASDRDDQARLSVIVDSQEDIADGVGILDPFGRHVTKAELVMGVNEILLFVVGEAVARVPQERFPVVLVQAECLLQFTQGLGRTGFIGLCH